MKKTRILLLALMGLFATVGFIACRDKEEAQAPVSQSYTVVYVQEGAEDKSITVSVGSTPSAESIPIIEYKTGYDAVWQTVDFSNAKGDDVFTVKAVYTAKAYTVSYDANGGNAIGGTTTVTYDSPYELKLATKDGYILDGYVYIDGSSVINIPYMGDAWKIDKDITVKAMYSSDFFVVTYDTNGGDALSQSTVEYGKPYMLKVPTKEGYNFVGWEIVGGDSPVAVSVSGTSWEYSKDVTLVAKWEVAQAIQVTFQQTGRENVYVTVVNNTIPHSSIPAIDQKVGYTSKWVNGADGTIIDWSNITDSIIVVVQDTPKTYTIKFNTNGGNTIADKTVVYGERYELPSAEKTDLAFYNGWSYNGTKVEQVGNEWTLDVDGDIVLDATYCVSVTYKQAGQKDVVRYYDVGHTVTSDELPTPVATEGKVVVWKKTNTLTNLQTNKVIEATVVDTQWTENK